MRIDAPISLPASKPVSPAARAAAEPWLGDAKRRLDAEAWRAAEDQYRRALEHDPEDLELRRRFAPPKPSFNIAGASSCAPTTPRRAPTASWPGNGCGDSIRMESAKRSEARGASVQ